MIHWYKSFLHHNDYGFHLRENQQRSVLIRLHRIFRFCHLLSIVHDFLLLSTYLFLRTFDAGNSYFCANSTIVSIFFPSCNVDTSLKDILGIRFKIRRQQKPCHFVCNTISHNLSTLPVLELYS